MDSPFPLLLILPAIAQTLIRLIQPIVVPICFVAAWMLIGISAWSLWSAVRDGVQRARRMHQIPCAQCQYFSGDYLLKCPVHPREALSESAIGCPDFESEAFGWQLLQSMERGS